jgi:hypothetical protein
MRRRAPRKAAGKVRLVCIEQVHGAAGISEFGQAQHMWNPAATGRRFDISKGSLSPLEAFRDQLTIVSQTDARMAEAMSAPEVGGDHFRSSAVMYTHAHPKLTEGSDVRVGTSMDQLYVQRPRQGHADSPRCSSASSRSISRAAAPTATPASTPTPSAGPRRKRRCR